MYSPAVGDTPQSVNLRSRGGGGTSSASNGTTASYAPINAYQQAPMGNQSPHQFQQGQYAAPAFPSNNVMAGETGQFYSGGGPSAAAPIYAPFPSAAPSSFTSSVASSSLSSSSQASYPYSAPGGGGGVGGGGMPLFPTPANGELGGHDDVHDSHDHGYGMNRGPSLRGSSPSLPSIGGSGASFSREGSPELGAAADDRIRRQQNAASIQQYLLFMYGMIGLSLFVMVLSWFTLGSAARYVVLVLSICVFSFLFTLKLTQWIFSKDDGNMQMRVISEAIREGSEGFLRVQYNAIAAIACVIAVVVGFVYLFRDPPSAAISPTMLAIVTAVSYLIGAFCSGLAGYIGVWVSIRVNIRVAVAASKYSFKDALLLSFRGGAVSACLSASLCILGVTILYVFAYLFFVTWGSMPARHVPLLLVGYGFGGALVALFMQLGGGIMTKAADVGADLTGKIEAGIPEDDPRNPAVIADLVGDNVRHTHTDNSATRRSADTDVARKLCLSTNTRPNSLVSSASVLLGRRLCWLDGGRVREYRCGGDRHDDPRCRTGARV